LTLSTVNRVSKIPEVRTRQRSMSYRQPATHNVTASSWATHSHVIALRHDQVLDQYAVLAIT